MGQDALGLVVPNTEQALSLGSLSTHLDHIGPSGYPDESGAYLGIPLMVALAWVLVALRRRRDVVFFAVMALVALVLSLGTRLRVDGHDTGLPLPWAVVAKLPLMDEVLANRLILYTWLFVAVLVALGLDAWRRQPARSRPVPVRLAFATVVVAVVATVVPALPYGDFVAAHVPPYFRTADVDAIPAHSVALLYPYPSPDANQGELWQVEAGLRFAMPGGYGLVPWPGTGAPVDQAWSWSAWTLGDLYRGVPADQTPALRRQLRAEWRSWGVSTVVFAPEGVDPARALRYLTWIIGRPPDQARGGVKVWYQVFGPARATAG